MKSIFTKFYNSAISWHLKNKSISRLIESNENSQKFIKGMLDIQIEIEALKKFILSKSESEMTDYNKSIDISSQKVIMRPNFSAHDSIEKLDQQVMKLEEQARVHFELTEEKRNLIEKLKKFREEQTIEIEKHAIINGSDLWHKITLTFLRPIQIIIFVFATYGAVTLSTWVFTEGNLVIPRGLINIVPSEALSVQPQDVQTPEPEKAQKSVTNSVTSKDIEK